MKKFIYIYLLLYLLVSCKIKKNVVDDDINNNTYDVVIYKFLYMNNYSIPLTEKAFWYNGKFLSEFATQNYNDLNEKQLLEFIYSQKKALPENNSNNIFWYKYAFVFPSSDTIYSNNRLDEWKVKRNGKVEYYSGPDENTPIEKTEFCGFFNSNPFFHETVYTKFPIKNDD